MNAKKQHVIHMAHQLFVDKGFQATSIQDILDYSGISKGTFYNYFSSKNELLISIIKKVMHQIEQGRNKLLAGQNPADIEIFIKQIELQLKTNYVNHLIPLFNEIFYADDEELKQFVKEIQIKFIHWLFRRFTDIFGESKQMYLLDSAIIFSAVLQRNLQFNAMAGESKAGVSRIVRYTMEQIVKLVDNYSEADDPLFHPELLKRWLPERKDESKVVTQKLSQIVAVLKKSLSRETDDSSKFAELLDFIREELLIAESPRKYLVESVILSLKSEQLPGDIKNELEKLEETVAVYFAQLEQNGG